MGGVALVSALLAGALVAPLVRDSAQDAVREPLGRQADLLARVSVLGQTGSPATRRRAIALASRTGVDLGLVDADGTRSGAARVLDDAEVRALLDGVEVSTEGVLDGTDVLVEARPSASGGAVVLVADTADVASTVDVVRRRVLVAIGVGLLASIGLAALLARRLGRPLRRLADAAHRLGEGERDVPVPDDGPDEVAEVSRALRALDRALATSEGRQREFLLSVSHELRTPLTAVRGYAEALADGVVPPEETGEVARTVLSETERLERYVADLLALARMQAEDFAVEPVPVDVIELLGAAARAWEEPGRRRGVTVGCAPLGTGVPVPELSTDPVRLRQVVDALVDNAVRVCGDGDRVVLEVVAEPGAVRVEVRDSGPGLTADDARVAFEPGVLHDRYAGRRPGGHGLGLAIVHRLVTRLGGTVEVGAAPEGGAAFVVRLPV